jgi:hypothetical protein
MYGSYIANCLRERSQHYVLATSEPTAFSESIYPVIKQNNFPYLMDVYFSSFTKTRQLSVSYKSHFSRKSCKMLITVSLMCVQTTWLLLLPVPCVSYTSDVCRLHAAYQQRCGHPWHIPCHFVFISTISSSVHITFCGIAASIYSLNFRLYIQKNPYMDQVTI